MNNIYPKPKLRYNSGSFVNHATRMTLWYISYYDNGNMKKHVFKEFNSEEKLKEFIIKLEQQYAELTIKSYK